MRILRLGTLLLIASIGAQSAGAVGPRIALAPGDTAPALVAHAYPNGSKVTFGYDRHRLTVVNFWATWCPPCFREMPALQGLHERHRDDGLQVIGVYVERASWKKIYDMITPLGIGYQLAMVHRTTDAAWGGVHSLPTTFLVDHEGRIVRRYVGATDPQIAGMVADVEAFLEGRELPEIVMPRSGNAVVGPGSPAAVAPPDDD